METKRCSKCGEVKLLECFGIKRKALDGRNYHCKACINATTAAHRSERPEQRGQWDRTYELRNREKIRASRRSEYAKTGGLRQAAYIGRPEVRGRQRLYQISYRQRNKAILKAQCAVRQRKAVSELSDCYLHAQLCQVLGVRAVELPVGLVALKREQLSLHRLGKQIKTQLKGSDK